MSLTGTEESEPRKCYISREHTNREAQRIHNQKSQPSEQKTEEIQPQFEDSNLQELQKEMLNLAYMKAAREQDARQDKEVTILLATVEKLCLIQQDFMQNMLKKFDEQNENQLKLLEIQKQYEESIQSSTYKVMYNIYAAFSEEQKNSFIEIQKYFESDIDVLSKKMIKVIKSVDKSSKYASETADRIYMLEGFKILLFYLSPLFVIIDIVIRLVTFYGG